MSVSLIHLYTANSVLSSEDDSLVICSGHLEAQCLIAAQHWGLLVHLCHIWSLESGCLPFGCDAVVYFLVGKLSFYLGHEKSTGCQCKRHFSLWWGYLTLCQNGCQGGFSAGAGISQLSVASGMGGILSTQESSFVVVVCVISNSAHWLISCS